MARGACEQTTGAKEGSEKLLMFANKIDDILDGSNQIKHYANETSMLNEEGKEAMKFLEEKFNINKEVSIQIAANSKRNK